MTVSQLALSKTLIRNLEIWNFVGWFPSSLEIIWNKNHKDLIILYMSFSNYLSVFFIS